MIKSKEKSKEKNIKEKILDDKLVIIKSCCMIMIEKHQCYVLLVILGN